MTVRQHASVNTLTLLIYSFTALVAIPGFVWLVGNGWWRVLVEWGVNRTSASWGASVLGLLALALATRMGDGYAVERVRQDLEPKGRKRWGWLQTWIFVFLFSGLGIVTSLYSIAEGSTVVQEKMEAARSSIATLRSEGERVLRDPVYDQKRAQVERLLSNLEATIKGRTQRYCGVGQQARGVVRQISSILPDYDFIPVGSDRVYDCSSPELDRLIAEYRDRAYEMLDNDTQSVTSGGRERRMLRAELLSGADRIQLQLTNADNAVRSMSPNPQDVRRQAIGVLQQASNFFADYRRRLDARALEPVRADLPRSIVVPTQDETVATIVPTLLSRLDHGTTWVYIFSALLIDFGLAYLLGQLIYTYRTRRRLRDPESDPWGTRANFGRQLPLPLQDPAFLWVNPRSD